MHTNALVREKSPYLRQHANNPVNWLPWGEGAFRKAREEDKPIFLSIGYSTCHWCHVMAHESFEDEATAEVLNASFVPIKVDREERPDVDRIYMLFVQASAGSGGWPLSVWLTPDRKPFFGGTYFPPDSRYGRPGFRDVLRHLAEAWRTDRERIASSSDRVVSQLRQLGETSARAPELDSKLFGAGFWQFRRMFDSKWGGFGSAPKFPRPVVLNYLLRYYHAEKNEEALEMVVQTLIQMAAGGMHDQLGGGFHRYSVDERWFVPHFEKMLYDQSQLAIAYLEAYQVTGNERLAEVARGIFRYVLRDLLEADGGFFSAEDADSPDPENPGHSGEGAFYIWRASEIERVLGKDAAVFCAGYGVEPGGNVEHDPQGEFTGRNILYLARSEEEVSARTGRAEGEVAAILGQARAKLFEQRNRRARPHLDDKVLTSWNGLMISALATGYKVLREQEYREAAEKAASFFLSRMRDADERLFRRYSGGEAAIAGFLDDYAFLAQGLLDLFEATFVPEYLNAAVELAGSGFTQFEDEKAGGYYSTPAGAPDLLMRMKDDYDGAEPAGNSVATDVLLRLAHITGRDDFTEKASRSLRGFSAKLQAQPTIAPQMLVALGRWLSEPRQIVLRSEAYDERTESAVRDAQKHFEPNTVILAVTDSSAQTLIDNAPFLAGLNRRNGLTIYRCQNFACQLPEVIPG
jgi:uncharacterized protein YyaL (SSP411 family)